LLTDEDTIRSVFNILDRDGNGVVDAEELALVLGMNSEVEKRKVKEIIREVDTNGDGVLSFEEFREAMFENIDTDHLDIGYKLDTIDIYKSDMGDIDLDCIESTEQTPVQRKVFLGP